MSQHSHNYWLVQQQPTDRGWYQDNLEDHLYFAHGPKGTIEMTIPSDPVDLARHHYELHGLSMFDLLLDQREKGIQMPIMPTRKSDPTVDLVLPADELERGDLVEIRVVGNYAGTDIIKGKEVIKLFRDPSVAGAGVHIYYRGDVTLVRRAEPDYVPGRIYEDAKGARFVHVEDKRWMAVDSSAVVYQNGRRVTVGQFYNFSFPVRPLKDTHVTH